MSRPVLYVYGNAGNTRYATLRTPNWRIVHGWLVDNKLPAMWSPTFRGWHVRTERVGDVIARAELAGFRVVMKGTFEQRERRRAQ